MDQVLAGVVRGANLIALLLLFYFYLTLVLSVFPQTRNFAVGFLGYILDPLRILGTGLVSYLPNLLFVLVAIVITRYILKATHVFFAAIERQTLKFTGFHPEWAQTTYAMVKMLFIAFVAVVIFPYLPGASSPAFQGISIFLGVLLSLGSSSAVANMVAGIILTYMRPFRVGDIVKIVDTAGIILEKNMLLTRIRTIKNVEITIPNSLVLGSHIVNYSASVGEPHLIVHTSVTIGYDAPWRKVHELLIGAAAATEEILQEPRPFVLQRSLDDFYVTYELNAYTDKPQRMAAIYSRLHENIQDRFNEAGVEILSPHYTQLRDGNKITVPEDYLPAGYEPGGLRIRKVGGEGERPGSGS
jgi:small-conductance mechanosensitive channel